MRRLILGSVLFFAATVSADASAQGIFDMGALNSALPGQPSAPAQPAAPGGGAAAAAAVPESAFAYKPSIEVRKRNFAQFVEKMRPSSPQGADEMQKLFAQRDVIAEFEPALAAYGLRTDNMADTFTVYWLNAWMASRGRTDQNTKEQVQAVRRQAVNAMRTSSQIGTLTDAQKQEFSEALLIQAMMLDVAVNQAKGNPQQLAQLQAGARSGAKAMSLDLDLMELTPTGFVKAAR